MTVAMLEGHLVRQIGLDVSGGVPPYTHSPKYQFLLSRDKSYLSM